jgi:raffinose/stachyose/melibiose transport system substrate-binding protein
MGAFPPPVEAEGDTCYISDHTDIAIGLNAASPNTEAARTFLNWVGSAGIRVALSNALPGFFSLSNEPVTLEDPLAQEFVSWRGDLRIDDPVDLPDPVARHAEPRERDLERLGAT